METKEKTTRRLRPLLPLLPPVLLSLLFYLFRGRQALMDGWVIHVMTPAEQLLGRLSAPLPFSLAEVLVTVFLTACALCLIRGTVLAVRDSLASNVGGSNVEILGFDFALPAVGDVFAVSESQASAYASLQTVFSVVQEKLGSFRDNIVSVEYTAALSGIEFSPSLFKIQTREGVRIVILMPETDMDTKIRAAIDVYQGTGDYTTAGGGTISDEDRTRGSIVVYASGTVAYTEREVDGVEDLPQNT